MKDLFNTIFRGMLVGIANIIPGVSGGTMAFVLGIYQQLTEAIGYFFIRPEKRKEYFLFLLKFGIGVIIGFLLFAKLITFLLGVNLPNNSPLPITYIPTFGFFLGLIVGSLPILIKLQTDTKFTSRRLLLIILGIITLFILSSFKESTNTIVTNSTLIKDFGIFKIVSLSLERSLWLIVIGILSAATMVIPGISGSALLVALGEYGPILSYVDSRSLTPLVFIMIGVGIGLILATLIMSKLLEHKAGATFYFIFGLIIASCIQIIIHMLNANGSITIWLYTIITIICGILLAIQSEKLQAKNSS